MLKKIKYLYVMTLLLLLLFCAGALYGAADPEYITKYGSDLFVRTYFAKKFTNLNYYSKDSDKNYVYLPNNPFNLGLGFTYKGLTLNGSYGLSFLKNDDYGDTDSADYQVNYYKGNFALGGVLQKYQGFYLDDGGDISLRPDIEVLNFGGYASYVFGGNKFSFKAAFNQTEKQLRSAGSFQAGIEVYYSRIEADKSLDPKGAAEKQKIDSFQFGPGLGYAYTWIIKKDFYVTLALMAGFNIDFNTVNGEDRTVAVRPSIFPRLAFGYDCESWGINLSYLQNYNFVADNSNENVQLTIGTLKLMYTRRFNL